MGRKEMNRMIFQDTLEMIDGSEKLKAAVEHTIQGQKLILETDGIPEGSGKRFPDTEIIVSGKRSLEAAAAYPGEKVCVLNFASATRPGGGVLRGCSAQEESICRCSTLYDGLIVPELRDGFYTPHYEAQDPLYNDDMIYSPDVLVIKTDTDMPERMEEKDWYPVNVITCAAPNLARFGYAGDPLGDKIMRRMLMPILEKRIRRIFAEAAAEGTDVLILGAFGCGAFHNPPDLVAGVFRMVTEEYRGVFRVVEYPVFHMGWETENYWAFRNAFSGTEAQKEE